MSRRRTYSPDTIGIIQRFYHAFETLVERKAIKSITKFCESHNIDKRHLYSQKKDLFLGFFEVGWLVPLINEHNISSEWLLTGSGEMTRAN